MDFSRIAKQINEENPALAAGAAASERALNGGQMQKSETERRKSKQKAQMAQQMATTKKSDVSYASEEYQSRREGIEKVKMYEAAKSDWRQQLQEEGNHPYVDVMPFVDQKAMEAKKQMKGAAKVEGGKQAMQAEEMTLKQHQEMMKNRPPKAKRKEVKPPKDTRSDAQKMTDATGPRPGSRFRGD